MNRLAEELLMGGHIAGIAVYGNVGIRCRMLDAGCSQLAGFAADGIALQG